MYIFAIIASLALLFGCSVHGSGGEGTFTEKKSFAGWNTTGNERSTLPFTTKASGSFVLRATSGDKEWTGKNCRAF